ncbi:MAG: hypothetical protein M3R27_03680 [Bacteroidota bacterium]|nr:hypothetical protein [Bacteroidota bacterium]
MKTFLLFIFCLIGLNGFSAEKEQPDTVLTGIYITSIHNIDFKQKEYVLNCWLWMKYKNPEFDFLQNLEIPDAKSFSKSFSTVDTTEGRIYILMKLQVVMKDSWKTENFPFDRQKLHLSIENSQFDSDALIFSADTSGNHFDPHFTLRGWTIDSLEISGGIKEYETAFGDPEVMQPHTEYSAFRVLMGIEREAMGLFWKMFLGMYVAFLIAYVCFFIHADSIDSRFGLSVGALFAVIGNKYIIDSSLPESITFTLVDILHIITLFFILGVVASTAFTLKLMKQKKLYLAKKYNNITSWIMLLAYVLSNAYFIWEANLS